MQLSDYLKKIGLPNKKIESKGQVSHLFLTHNILTLWDAVNYIHLLAYERTTDRENYFQVLEEKRGTCSVKHALIASLAQEQLIPLKLVLGIFFLTRENMPKIASILDSYKINKIPEAHCFLKYETHSLDITFPESTDFSFNVDLEQEFTINPHQIGLFKVEKHQAFIRDWGEKQDISFDLIWNAREAWIKKLSEDVRIMIE